VHHLKVNGYLDWNETSLVDKFNSNSANWSSVQSVLTAALYPSIARYDPAGGSLATANHAEGESLLHHTSALLLLGNNSNAQKPNSNWHFSLKVPICILFQFISIIHWPIAGVFFLLLTGFVAFNISLLILFQ